MYILVQIVDISFRVYYFLVLARVFLSYIRHNPYHPLINFIYEFTEPVLGFFRRLIPPLGMVDFSPMVALFALELLRWIVVSILINL